MYVIYYNIDILCIYIYMCVCVRVIYTYIFTYIDVWKYATLPQLRGGHTSYMIMEKMKGLGLPAQMSLTTIISLMRRKSTKNCTQPYLSHVVACGMDARDLCCSWRLFRLEMLKSTMECVALIVNTKVGVHMDSVGMSVVTLFINVCPSWLWYIYIYTCYWFII